MYSLFLLTVFGGVMWQVGAHTVITYPGWRGMYFGDIIHRRVAHNTSR